MHEKAIFIQLDANSKLGPEVIKGDPHKQSENGKILAAIIKRNAMIVMNSVESKCIGMITRRRITRKVREESIIDFVIVCEEMEELISEVTIDEERKHVLVRHVKTKNGVKIKESDHNSIVTKVKVKWNKIKNIKPVEIYNLKDTEGLKKFKEMTGRDHFLSEVFTNETKNISVKTKYFIKRLGFVLSQCFKKIRIKQTKRNKEIEKLFNTRRILRPKKDDHSKKLLEDVDNKLSELCAKDNLDIINKACEGLSCENGGVNAGKLWQLKKKLRGIVNQPPTAMLDQYGNLVTNYEELSELTLKTYIDRLKALEIREDLKVHKMQREQLCKDRLKEAQEIKTPNWTMIELNTVLKQLKNNKSRDPLGFANELFKPQNAGEDLKIATLTLMNQIKTTQTIPEVLKQCNISSLYKNKGSRKDVSNYRGIFRVTILRSILDKLIYNDEYPGIDKQLTDSNVGARKGRNIRDNIFVINAVMNNVAKKKLKNTDITIYDAEKCFDKLWAQECFNDVYENGFKNDKLTLLYEENVNAKVAVKVHSGITKRVNINENIMQGTVWGSLFCTCTIDKLGKHAYEHTEMLYKYKGVPIPPLGMVDDILTVSDVKNTEAMNKLVNTFIEKKNLRLSKEKCSRIHIGKGHDKCPELMVHKEKMNNSDREKYLGDMIDKTGTLQATIDKRKTKGDGIVAEILSIVSEIPLGKHKIEVALRLREAMLVNGILFNSEAWHGVTNAHIVKLESVDEALLRGILKAHSKTPKEFLHFETGTIPLRWIMTQRRINYMNHILSKDDDELIKKVFLAQKETPTQGDFAKLIEKDLKELNITYEEAISNRITKKKLKTLATNAAFKQLQEKLQSHKKVKHLKYEALKIQPYLTSDMFTQDDRKTLTALRSHCVKGVRHNFSKLFKLCLKCPLKCNREAPQEDTQDHLLKCVKLSKGINLNLNDIVSEDLHLQANIAKTITVLLKKRQRLIDDQEESSSSLPGALFLDQTSQQQLQLGVAVMQCYTV